jgi:hypothetical protein
MDNDGIGSLEGTDSKINFEALARSNNDSTLLQAEKSAFNPDLPELNNCDKVDQSALAKAETNTHNSMLVQPTAALNRD